MAKKTTNTEKKTFLRTWFFDKPAKFALLAMATFIGFAIVMWLLSMVMGVSNVAMTPTMNTTEVIYAILACLGLAGVFIFSVCKLVKWLPSDTLDRRSYVAVDNGLTFIYMLASIAYTALLISYQSQIILTVYWLRSYSMALAFIFAILFVMSYLYFIGVMIANVYATYRRALAMGVPRWKALLTLPFMTSFFWFPGYLLPDESRAKPAIAIKTKWYSDLTNWIVARPINAVLVFVLTLALYGLFFDVVTGAVLFIALALFGLLTWIVGAKKLLKNIGGGFSTFLAALNIAVIITLIATLAYVATKPAPHVPVESIEVIDTGAVME